jgi:fructoselysine-6-P-deglycase FrlB-like protein
MSFVGDEIATQPQCWRRAADLAATSDVVFALPARGARVAVIGCGTSWFMAQSCAALREAAGAGETDAFAASEFPADRRYDHVVALTRSGTTTEVLRALAACDAPSTVVTTARDLPAARAANFTVALDFADERSVVQTRFATTALALWRAWLGFDPAPSVAAAHQAIESDIPDPLVTAARYAFLGTGWTVGLAHEAALKLREAAAAWTESSPAMEFRHGPISVVDADSVVWVFGDAPEGLLDDLAATGGTVRATGGDPMAELLAVQRVAVLRAQRRGLDPDHPRHLTRSIVLSDT